MARRRWAQERSCARKGQRCLESLAIDVAHDGVVPSTWGVSRTIRQRQALAMQPDIGHVLVLSDNDRDFPSHDAAIGQVYVIGSVGDDERQLAIAPVCHLDGFCVVQIRGPCRAHWSLLAVRLDDRGEGTWPVSLLGLGEARTSVPSTSGSRTS